GLPGRGAMSDADIVRRLVQYSCSSGEDVLKLKQVCTEWYHLISEMGEDSLGERENIWEEAAYQKWGVDGEKLLLGQNRYMCAQNWEKGRHNAVCKPIDVKAGFEITHVAVTESFVWLVSKAYLTIVDSHTLKTLINNIPLPDITAQPQNLKDALLKDPELLHLPHSPCTTDGQTSPPPPTITDPPPRVKATVDSIDTLSGKCPAHEKLIINLESTPETSTDSSKLSITMPTFQSYVVLPPSPLYFQQDISCEQLVSTALMFPFRLEGKVLAVKEFDPHYITHDQPEDGSISVPPKEVFRQFLVLLDSTSTLSVFVLDTMVDSEKRAISASLQKKHIYYLPCPDDALPIDLAHFSPWGSSLSIVRQQAVKDESGEGDPNPEELEVLEMYEVCFSSTPLVIDPPTVAVASAIVAAVLAQTEQENVRSGTIATEAVPGAADTAAQPGLLSSEASAGPEQKESVGRVAGALRVAANKVTDAADSLVNASLAFYTVGNAVGMLPGPAGGLGNAVGALAGAVYTVAGAVSYVSNAVAAAADQVSTVAAGEINEASDNMGFVTASKCWALTLSCLLSDPYMSGVTQPHIACIRCTARTKVVVTIVQRPGMFYIIQEPGIVEKTLKLPGAAGRARSLTFFLALNAFVVTEGCEAVPDDTVTTINTMSLATGNYHQIPAPLEDRYKKKDDESATVKPNQPQSEADTETKPYPEPPAKNQFSTVSSIANFLKSTISPSKQGRPLDAVSTAESRLPDACTPASAAHRFAASPERKSTSLFSALPPVTKVVTSLATTTAHGRSISKVASVKLAQPCPSFAMTTGVSETGCTLISLIPSSWSPNGNAMLAKWVMAPKVMYTSHPEFSGDHPTNGRTEQQPVCVEPIDTELMDTQMKDDGDELEDTGTQTSRPKRKSPEGLERETHVAKRFKASQHANNTNADPTPMDTQSVALPPSEVPQTHEENDGTRDFDTIVCPKPGTPTGQTPKGLSFFPTQNSVAAQPVAPILTSKLGHETPPVCLVCMKNLSHVKQHTIKLCPTCQVAPLCKKHRGNDIAQAVADPSAFHSADICSQLNLRHMALHMLQQRYLASNAALDTNQHGTIRICLSIRTRDVDQEPITWDSTVEHGWKSVFATLQPSFVFDEASEPAVLPAEQGEIVNQVALGHALSSLMVFCNYYIKYLHRRAEESPPGDTPVAEGGQRIALAVAYHSLAPSTMTSSAVNPPAPVPPTDSGGVGTPDWANSGEETLQAICPSILGQIFADLLHFAIKSSPLSLSISKHDIQVCAPQFPASKVFSSACDSVQVSLTFIQETHPVTRSIDIDWIDNFVPTLKEQKGDFVIGLLHAGIKMLPAAAFSAEKVLCDTFHLSQLIAPLQPSPLPDGLPYPRYFSAFTGNTSQVAVVAIDYPSSQVFFGRRTMYV
ncbi:hypothetical protein DIPPA_18976, partial [Diplonema papillatum]